MSIPSYLLSYREGEHEAFVGGDGSGGVIPQFNNRAAAVVSNVSAVPSQPASVPTCTTESDYDNNLNPSRNTSRRRIEDLPIPPQSAPQSVQSSVAVPLSNFNASLSSNASNTLNLQ